MFTTNLLLLMPVIGAAAGLAAAMLVVRHQDARLASVGFGTKGARVLIPHYTKEGALVAMAIPLAVLIFGSCAFMLEEGLKQPLPPKGNDGYYVIPYDSLGLPPTITDDPNDGFKHPPDGPTPTPGGRPTPVPDNMALADSGGDGGNWLPPDPAYQFRGDSVKVAQQDSTVPDKGYVALDRFPELVKRVDPVYPAIAVATGSEGRVFVQLLLDLDGSVLRAEVQKSSGNPALDEAALMAVKQWVFTPAIAPGGKPARVWQLCPVSFKLSR